MLHEVGMEKHEHNPHEVGTEAPSLGTQQTIKHSYLSPGSISSQMADYRHQRDRSMHGTFVRKVHDNPSQARALDLV